MEELYSIMRDLLELEYNQESLLYVLETLETAYEEPEQRDLKRIVNYMKGGVNSLQTELNKAIRRMDGYLAACGRPEMKCGAQAQSREKPE